MIVEGDINIEFLFIKYFKNSDKRTLKIALKTSVKRKELDPNRDLPVEPTLLNS